MTRRLTLASLAIIALIAGGFALAVSSLAQPHSSPDAMAGMSMPMGTMPMGAVTPDTGSTITIANFAFTGTFTVAPGSTVTVTNSDSVSHTLTANGGAFDTGIIAAGATKSFVAPSANGQYGFHCSIHSSMTGTLTIGAAPHLTVPPVTKHGLVDTAYTASATATGGNGHYTFSISAGTLPPGVKMSTAGAFTGTPTIAGTFAFTLAAVDTSSPALHGSVSTGITVDPMTVATTSLSPTGILDTYAAKLLTHGGKSTFVWTVIGGSLPTGIKLSTAGVFSGAAKCVDPTPTCAVGTSTFTVQVTDHGIPKNTATASLTLTVLPETITTTSLPSVAVDQTYPATTLTKVGGGTAVKWVVSSGQLPPGIVLSTTGHLTGRPTMVGSFAFHIRVQPSSTTVTEPRAGRDFTIVIAPMTISTSSLPNATVKKAYSAKLLTVGGKTPLHWSETGALPPGVHLSAAGALSGTPTVAGTYTMTFTVADSTKPAYTAATTLTITVV